jgi:hypothetical protein
LRYLLGFLCVCVLGVIPLVGCDEGAGDGGSGGSAGSGGRAGVGGDGGIGGSAGTGVGDPCVLDMVPAGGFLAEITYLATGSVQCKTRVCLVRGLMGDPNNLQEEDCPLGDATCVAASEVERSVYCSCRCKAGSGVPTCDCPGGFICEEVLETGGDGLRGSYCVREDVGM